jgi:hypothetical protein
MVEEGISVRLYPSARFANNMSEKKLMIIAIFLDLTRARLGLKAEDPLPE